MNKEDFTDLIARLKNSSIPDALRDEAVAILLHQRRVLEDIYLGVRQGSQSAERLAGIALGKSGYGSVGDMGF